MVDIADHYWSNGTDVFGSRLQTRVPYADPAYQSWLAAGNLPTRDPGPAELRQLLSPYGIGLSPAETTKLQKFQRFAANPSLLARVVVRLIRLLVSKGTITAGEANGLLNTDEQTDPDS